MRKYASPIACGFAVVLVVVELVLTAHVHVLLGDFRAFYCAGATLLHGGNPYAAGPVYACERPPAPFGLYRAEPGVAVPAPFPGYALAFFALFGALPFVIAAALWLIVLFATTAVTCVALARLCGREIGAAVAVVIVGLAVFVLQYGALTSIELSALLCFAIALSAKQWNAATVAAAFAMIIPHVGIPAVAGVFLWQTQMRWRLALLAAGLVVLDVLAGGAHVALAYVTDVLPAHALSEIGRVSQYSLTWMLHAGGVRDAIAIRAGELCYVLMLAAGVYAGGALARRSKDMAYAVLVPPAFAVFGGSFIHYTEIIVAVAAAALLAVRATIQVRSIFAAAVVLLAMPWIAVIAQSYLVIAFAIATFGIGTLLFNCDARTALRISLGAVLVAGAILVAANIYGPGIPQAGGAALNPALAQASWAQYMGGAHSSAGLIYWIGKAPTWIGLALLTIGCAYAAVVNENLVTPVVIEQAPVIS